MQIMVGHPDAHRRVFLSHQLAACDGVAIFVPNPFAQPKLDDAEQQCRNTEPTDAAPVALAVKENEVDGLAQSEEQGHRP